MGIDDLIDDEKKEEKKTKSNDIADDLGIESAEELEQLDGRISRLYESLMRHDKRIESLEDDVELLMGALAKTMREVTGNKINDVSDDSDESDENRNGFEW